jgi:hypothetical protein
VHLPDDMSDTLLAQLLVAKPGAFVPHGEPLVSYGLGVILRRAGAAAAMSRRPWPASESDRAAGFEVGEEVEEAGGFPDPVPLGFRQGAEYPGFGKLIDGHGGRGLAPSGGGYRHGDGDDRMGGEDVDDGFSASSRRPTRTHSRR